MSDKTYRVIEVRTREWIVKPWGNATPESVLQLKNYSSGSTLLLRELQSYHTAQVELVDVPEVAP